MRLTTKKCLSSKEKERSLLEGGYHDEGPRYMTRSQNRRKEETQRTSPRLPLRPPRPAAASQPLSQGSAVATEETTQSDEKQSSLLGEGSRPMTRSQMRRKAPPPSQPPSQVPAPAPAPAMEKPKKRNQSDVLAESVPEGKKSTTREYSKYVSAGGYRHPTSKEIDYYQKKMKENGGYDYVALNGRLRSSIFHIPLLKSKFEMFPLDRACQDAISEYNAKEKTMFRFEKIIKVLTNFWRYYATFKVRGPNDELETLQARFFLKIEMRGPFKVEEVRLKPKPMPKRKPN